MSVSLTSDERVSKARYARAVVPALCVDLDGALIRSDLLLESLILLFKRNPFYLLLIPLWRLRGREVLKAEISSRVMLNPETLPYDRELISWLESQRGAGRSLWLCTGWDPWLGAHVASRLGIFEGVLAIDRDVHLSGATRAARLVEQFGEGGFDYCGSERRDLAIWERAHGAIVVRGHRRLERDAARRVPVLLTFPIRVKAMRAIARAVRPHQWTKNILILVPLMAAHRADEAAGLAAALLASIAFCLCASSVYVVNDLLDLEADRAHVRKSKRPLAAGDLSLLNGLMLVPSLLGAALLVAAFLPGTFLLVLATYYSLTLAYSFGLKGVVLTDAVVLAGLYTLRIVAGAAAVGVPLSFWMLLFSVFLFLSLALVKRFSELDMLRRQQRLRAAGRGYHVEDLPLLQTLGGAAGYLSVLVLALYVNSPEIEALYRRPKVIWMLCVLMLYWISWVWMKAQRGTMHDDPVVFALKDRMSVAVGLLAAATVVLAI